MAASFSDFIAEKRVEQLAEVCGAAVPTVYWWKQRLDGRGLIPRKHWDALMSRWPDLKYRHLKAMEDAAKSRTDGSARQVA